MWEKFDSKEKRKSTTFPVTDFRFPHWFTIENVFVDSASCKVAWFNHAAVIKVCHSRNLEIDWANNSIFYCVFYHFWGSVLEWPAGFELANRATPTANLICPCFECRCAVFWLGEWLGKKREHTCHFLQIKFTLFAFYKWEIKWVLIWSIWFKFNSLIKMFWNLAKFSAMKMMPNAKRGH